MKLGLILPTIGAGAGPEALDAAGETAQRLGWSSVWATDHLLVPAGPEADEYGWALEATTALTWVAARCPGVRVGLQRDHPGHARRAVACEAARDTPTFSAAAGSRSASGSATNQTSPSTRTSARATGSQSGARTSTRRSHCGVTCGRDEPTRSKVSSTRCADFNFQPLPVQGAALPIICGGRSDRALRRAAWLCDGYHAAQTGPADVAARIPTLHAEAEAAGRPPVAISVRVRVRFDQGALAVYSLHGDAEAMRAEVAEFAQTGVDELVVVFKETAPDELGRLMERFDAEVYRPALEQAAG